MKNAYAELKALRGSWDTLRRNRPSETNFAQFGFDGIAAKHFDEQFEEWDKALASAINATKPANVAEEKVVEAIVMRSLREARTQVDAAQGNGMQWLIAQSPFLARIAEAQTAMAPVVERRFRLRKGTVSQAMEQVNNDLLTVENAAPIAREIVELQSTIQGQAEEVASSVEAATAAKEQAQQEHGQVSETLEQVKQAAEQVNESKAGIAETLAEITAALAEAKRELQGVNQSKLDADKKIVAGTEQIEQAKQKLTAALADVNRQGLAGSFEKRAKELGWERVWWMIAFALSIIWLALVAMSITWPKLLNIPPATEAPTIWEGLLRSIPLLAPGIWLGWLSAKSAGLAARIQQDYRYKVATAVAFEGYKKEVAQLEDKELAKRLAEIAVQNFGDNPIRIYEGHSVDGHPAEALKAMFADRALFDQVIQLLNAVRKK